MTVNSVMTLRDAAVEGLGIALLPTYCIGRELAEGSLVELLPRYKGPSEDVTVLFPHRRLLPAKSRLFIDFMAEQFRDPPWDRAAKAAT